MKFRDIIPLMAFAFCLTGCNASTSHKAIEYMNTIEQAGYSVVAEDDSKSIVELSCKAYSSNVFVHIDGEEYMTNYWGVKYSSDLEAATHKVLINKLGSAFEYKTKVFANHFDDGKTAYSLKDFMSKVKDNTEISITVSDTSLYPDWETVFGDLCTSFITSGCSLKFTMDVPGVKTYTASVDAELGAYSW